MAREEGARGGALAGMAMGQAGSAFSAANKQAVEQAMGVSGSCKEPAEAMDAVQALLAGVGAGKQSGEAALEAIQRMVDERVQQTLQQSVQQAVQQAVQKATQAVGQSKVRASNVRAKAESQQNDPSKRGFHGIVIPLNDDGVAETIITAKAAGYVHKLEQVLKLMHEADGEEEDAGDGGGDLPPKTKAMKGFKVETAPNGSPLVMLDGKRVGGWVLGDDAKNINEIRQILRRYVMPEDTDLKKDFEKFLAALGFSACGTRLRKVVQVEVPDGSKELKVISSYPRREFHVVNFAEQHVHGLCKEGRLNGEGFPVRVFVRHDENITRDGYIRIPRSKAAALQQERREGGLKATPLATVRSFAMSLGLQVVEMEPSEVVDKVVKQVVLKNVAPDVDEAVEAAGEQMEEPAAGEQMEEPAAGSGKGIAIDEFPVAEALENAANKANEIAKAMDLEESTVSFSRRKRKREEHGERSSLRKALLNSEFEW
tara:strand:+ start:1375 stop:2829 length:1455 start_codon:yes stop_codon:yes gene_type:complete